MKTLAITSVLFFVTLTQAVSQNLFVHSYMEKTQVSPKAGIQLGYQTANNYEVGVFFQKEVDMANGHESNKPRFYEKEFIGIILASQIFAYQHLNVNLDVRIGAINKTNFAITPSVKVDYEIIKRIYINAGIGVRSFNPTLQGGLRIDIY